MNKSKLKEILKECKKSYQDFCSVSESLRTGFAILDKPKRKSFRVKDNPKNNKGEK